MKRILAAVTVYLAFALAAFAAPITFIHTGTGSGTLDGVGFDAAPFTITATGDTDDRAAIAVGFFIDHLTATIDIQGVGVVSFVTGTRTFINDNNNIVGFSRAGSQGADLYNGPSNVLFDGWDMLTSIGPIDGTTQLLQWLNSAVSTSGGVLVFDSGQTRGTFEAIVGTVVPEPAPVALLAVGAAMLAFRRRRA